MHFVRENKYRLKNISEEFIDLLCYLKFLCIKLSGLDLSDLTEGAAQVTQPIKKLP